MEERRAETFKALSTFIEKQRALLTKTQLDIARLKELKNKVVAEPEDFADNLSEELDDGAFRLSELEESVLDIPKNIDWSLYAKSDATPFHTLRLEAQKKRQPSLTSSSGLSDFQNFVRGARATLLDPIFTKYNLSFHPIPEPDEKDSNDVPVDPAELKKAKEREKIKELKERKIVSCGLTVSSTGNRPRGPGVFIRSDLVDESMEVDISAEDDARSTVSSVPGGATKLPPTAAPTPPWGAPFLEPSIPLALSRSSRSRRQSSKLSSNSDAMSTPPPRGLTTRRKSSRAPSSCAEGPLESMNVDQTKSFDVGTAMDTDPPLPPTPVSPLSMSGTPTGADAASSFKVLGKRSREEEKCSRQDQETENKGSKTLTKQGKPKPETYKQAWSVSEQHLLEKLLQEIPEGEKNRWKKISIAMNGRRTPRQVASRVQKYFEKLKRFGINIDD